MARSRHCSFSGWPCYSRRCYLRCELDSLLDASYGGSVEVRVMGSEPSQGSHGVRREAVTTSTVHETAASSRRTAPTSYRARSRGL